MPQSYCNRARLILIAGALVQILAGIPAAWGVFRGPVMDGYALSAGDSESIFSWILGAYGPGCVMGGFVQDKKGPRTAGLWGTALITGGFFAAACLPAGTRMLFILGFSLPIGLGCAFLTPAVLSCAQKWYQQRKGLATGVIGGAVGVSGGVLTFLVHFFTRRWGIRGCFWALGAVALLVCTIGSLLLTEPPPQKQRPQDQGKHKGLPAPDYAPKAMLRTQAFWLCFLCAGLAAPSVQLFGPIVPQITDQRGLPPWAAPLCITLGSVGSAAGRLLMPPLSDRIGRKTTDLWLFGALVLFGLGFWLLGSWWTIPVYFFLCLCYAGQAAVLPALCSDLFGLAHAGVDYGFTALGMSLGSLSFPLLAQLLPFSGRHWIALAAAGGGFVCVALLKAPPPKPTGTVAKKEPGPCKNS